MTEFVGKLIAMAQTNQLTKTQARSAQDCLAQNHHYVQTCNDYMPRTPSPPVHRPQQNQTAYQFPRFYQSSSSMASDLAKGQPFWQAPKTVSILSRHRLDEINTMEPMDMSED